MSEVIPLFPLGTVLFPGLLLPLNVFEPRYRQLVADLLALPNGEPRRFGVVAIRQGREVGPDEVTALYEVGCTAELRRVDPQDDGTYHLVTTGARRFSLGRVDRDSKPYLQAEVDWLDAPETAHPDATEGLRDSVAAAFVRYLEVLGDARGAQLEAPPLPDDPTVLSYLVAAAVVLDLPDKQALLAAADTRSRLTDELALLRRETALLTRLPAAPATELTRLPLSPN